MSTHRGKPDEDAHEWEARANLQKPRRLAEATEHSQAKHTFDSQRALSHNMIDCPRCDPKGYAEFAAKHKAGLR